MFVEEKTKPFFLQGYSYGTALILLIHSLDLALSGCTDGLKKQQWVPDPAYPWLNLQPSVVSSVPTQCGLVEALAQMTAGSFEGCLLPSHVEQPGLQVRSALLHSKEGGRCLQATGLWAAILKCQNHKHLTPASLAGDGN